MRKELLFADFPIEEYKNRIARALTLMEEHAMDALLVTQEENVRYLAGYRGIMYRSKFRPQVALIPQDLSRGAALALSGREGVNAQASWIEEVVLVEDDRDIMEQIAEVIRSRGLGGATIGTELGFGQRLGMTIAQFEALRAFLPEIKWADMSPVTRELRMVKSPAEVEMIRRACQLTCKGIRAGWEALHEGMSERELASVMCSTMIEGGADFAMDVIAINAGPQRNKALNSLPSNYRFAEGDMVMFDGGCRYYGYICDMIRQANVGPPTRKQERWFNIAIEANEAAQSGIKPGGSTTEVYRAAYQVLDKAGLTPYAWCKVWGHGIGLELHEEPIICASETLGCEEQILRPGMVLAIEPHFAGMDGPDWPSGRFIVENNVVVTDSGYELLTDQLSNDLWVV